MSRRRTHYDHRRRSGHHYDRRRSSYRGHHHRSRSGARWTTLALWALIIIALGNGMITITGK